MFELDITRESIDDQIALERAKFEISQTIQKYIRRTKNSFAEKDYHTTPSLQNSYRQCINSFLGLVERLELQPELTPQLLILKQRIEHFRQQRELIQQLRGKHSDQQQHIQSYNPIFAPRKNSIRNLNSRNYALGSAASFQSSSNISQQEGRHYMGIQNQQNYQYQPNTLQDQNQLLRLRIEREYLRPDSESQRLKMEFQREFWNQERQQNLRRFQNAMKRLQEDFDREQMVHWWLDQQIELNGSLSFQLSQWVQEYIQMMNNRFAENGFQTTRDDQNSFRACSDAFLKLVQLYQLQPQLTSQLLMLKQRIENFRQQRELIQQLRRKRSDYIPIVARGNNFIRTLDSRNYALGQAASFVRREPVYSPLSFNKLRQHKSLSSLKQRQPINGAQHPQATRIQYTLQSFIQ